MTSVDSGVETSNDSNDSSATHDFQATENNSPVKTSCSTLPPSQFNGFSSSSQDSEKDFKEEPDRRLVIQNSSNEMEFQFSQCLRNVNFFQSLTFRPPSLRTSGVQLVDIGGIGTAASSSTSSQFTFSIPFKSLGASAFCKESSADDKGCKKTLKTKIRVLKHRHCFLNPIGLQGERKLRLAASTNNVEAVKHLLNNGVNPNCFDNQRRSPLHLASCRGFADVVRTLLEHGANPNQRDSLGNTPLHLAACTNHVAVVTLLLKAGTDVSSNDMHGRNPLKLAMSKLRLLKNLSSLTNDSEVQVNPDAQKIKMEVQQVIEMLQEYLNKKGRETEAELLTAFSSRLNLSSSQQEVDDEVRGLLTSLNSLSIQSPETPSSQPSTSSFLGASTSSSATQSTFLSFSTPASEQATSSSSQMTVSIPQLHPPPPVIPFRLPLGRFDFPNPSAMTNPFHLNPPCFEAPFAWVSSPSAPASSSEGDA